MKYGIMKMCVGHLGTGFSILLIPVPLRLFIRSSLPASRAAEGTPIGAMGGGGGGGPPLDGGGGGGGGPAFPPGGGGGGGGGGMVPTSVSSLEQSSLENIELQRK